MLYTAQLPHEWQIFNALRAAPQKSLAIVAAKFTKLLPLPFMLHTFSQNLLAHIMGHGDNRLHQNNGVLVLRKSQHELLVDLDGTDG